MTNKDYEYKDKAMESSPKLSLKQILDPDCQNLCDYLEQEHLTKISHDCLEQLEDDEKSMQSWMDYADKAMTLCKLEREEKHTPWRNASNIKFPMISTAVIQWCSRAGDEFIRNGKVVKYKVQGQDLDGKKGRRGKRVSMHLNYQIMEKMPNWQNERDRLLYQLAVVGTSYTKTWFDAVNGCIRSELVPYDCIVVNNGIRDMHTAPAISHYIYRSTNECIEMQRWELFRDDIDFDEITKDKTDPDAIFHELVEQHCWLDLDGDGYKEPYIVTIHVASDEVLRILPRFEKDDIQYNSKKEIKKIFGEEYFSSYHFIPNPDGTWHSIGYGTLLLDCNATYNTVLNQLINAGTLASTQGGLIGKDLRIDKEDLEIDPGEWIIADAMNGATIKDNMVPFNYKEPSQVLLALLTTLEQAANKLCSTTDALVGTADTTNTSPNTLMQLIQQGLKVYGAIFRRVGRGYKSEIKKVFKLNAKYVNVQEYVDLISPSPQEKQEMFNQYGQFIDYDVNNINIVPVVDANDSTQLEIMARSQMEVQLAQQIQQAFPTEKTFNPRAIARNSFDAIETPNINQLVVPDPDPNAPNPQVIAMQHKMQMDQAGIQLQDKKLQIEAAKAPAQIKEHTAKAFKSISDADAKHKELGLATSQHHFDKVMGSADVALQVQKMNQDMVKTASSGDSSGQSPQKQPQDPKADMDQTMDAAHEHANAVPMQGAPDQSMQQQPHSATPMISHETVMQEAFKRGFKPKHTKDQIRKEALRRGFKDKK